MATTTRHYLPSAGSYQSFGVTTAFSDGGTIDTGLIKVDGFLAITNTADTVASLTSQSAGVATVAVKTAGAGPAGTVTIYWHAWQLTRST